MTNATKFNEVFRLFASEIWAMPEADFLRWLNGEYNGEERKTGKWISVDSYTTFKCSVCGNFLDFHGVNAGRGDANYCPNCGAKMEGEGDETD